MEHIYKLVRRDSYRRFIGSKQFKQLQQIEITRRVTEDDIVEVFETEKRTTNKKAERDKMTNKKSFFQRIKKGVTPRVSSQYTCIGTNIFQTH